MGLRRPVLLFLALLLFFQHDQAPAEGGIRTTSVASTAIGVANYLDRYREAPEKIVLSNSQEISVADGAKLFAHTVLAIFAGRDSLQIPTMGVLPPEDPSPPDEPDSTLFHHGITREGYVAICALVDSLLTEGSRAPNSFQFSQGSLRFIETLYLLAGVLRFYAFYEYLPDSFELLVFPSGLVPWKTPAASRQYTAALSGWRPNHFQRYYFYSVGKYPVYRIAKRFIADKWSTPLSTAEDIFNGGKARWLANDGYQWWQPTFGFPSSSYDYWRRSLTNSSYPYLAINMLLRTLGIPCAEYRLLDPDNSTWISIDVHLPFGSAPLGWNGTEQSPWDRGLDPRPDDAFVERIRSIMQESGGVTEKRNFVWINAEDIVAHGRDSILSVVKRGGFNAVILTVKDEMGLLYYPTVSYSVQNERFKHDALTPFVAAAKENDIDVYAGVSIFADRFSVMYAEMGILVTDSPKDWFEYASWSNPKNYLSTMSCTPCAREYRRTITGMVEEIAGIRDLKGIVLAHLFWDDISYLIPPDANPLCDSLRSGNQWQENLLEQCASELTSAVKQKNSTMDVLLAAYSPSFSYYRYFDGMQNMEKLAKYFDGIILPIQEFHWLRNISELGVITSPSWLPRQPDPFDLDEYIASFRNVTSKPLYVSFLPIDEWEYTPLFYSGLLSHVSKLGCQGIGIHNFNSLCGVWGEAFSATQLQKIGEVDFSRTYRGRTTAVDGQRTPESPSTVVLSQNFPNPFNPRTEIRFRIAQFDQVTVRVYDLLGREVAVLVNEKKEPGDYSVSWNAQGMASGTYVCRLMVGTAVQTRKILLLR